MDKSIFHRWFGSATPAPVPAQESVKAMAARGVAEAQFSLGLKHATGKGAAQDYSQAEHWYHLAADQNHALAQFNLGIMHAKGQGVPADPVKSLAWIQRSADLGDAGAQYRLGLTHQRAIRDGLPAAAAQSRIGAFQWLRLAADQNYPGAEDVCVMVNLQMTRADVAAGQRFVAAFNDGSYQRGLAA